MRPGLRGRLTWVATFAALAALARARAGRAGATEAEVAAQLGAAVGGTVAPDDYVWEPSSGALRDTFEGRLVTFTASLGGPRDVFRARVRVARSGRTLGVREVHRVTDTPLADEGELVGSHQRIAFRATEAGRTLGLGVLLLDGAPPPDDAPRWERALLALERRLDTGSSRGLGRVDVVLEEPASELRFDLDERGLVFAVGDGVPSLVPLPPAPRGRALHQPSFAAADRTPEAPRGPSLLAALADRFGARALAASLRARAPRPAPDLSPPPAAGAPPAEAGWPPDGAAWSALAGAPIVHARFGSPEAPVDAFALDLRQLDLELVPGASPRGRAGPAPIGGLSEDQRGALVAAFALSPDSRALVGGRELAPLAPGLPTLARAAAGLTLGASPPASPLFAVQGPADAQDALAIERSYACRARGALLYLHAPRATAGEARAALSRAGCEASLALAAWPAPAGLVVLGAEPRAAGPGMSLAPEGLEAPAGPLVVLRKRPTRPDGGAWVPDAGEQPAPTWAPAVFQVTVTEGSASVPVLRVRAERVRWAVRVGRDEPGKQPSQPALDGLLALGAGTTRKKGSLGLVLDGDPIVRSHAQTFASLLVGRDGRVSLERGPRDAAGGSVLELPLLADEGKVLPEGQTVGQSRFRAALCVLADGSLLVASGEHDTDEPLVLALTGLGCARVAGLDRGAHEGVYLARKGVSAAPEGAAAWTRLVAVGAPLDVRVGE